MRTYLEGTLAQKALCKYYHRASVPVPKIRNCESNNFWSKEEHKMSDKSRNWCFTLNNYTVEELEGVSKWPVRYYKYGIEVGASGTPHLQGYCVMENAVRLSTMKKMAPRAHWEIMKGSIEQNDKYVEKDGKYFERGEKPMSQKRKGECEAERWELALQAAKNGEFDSIPADIRIKYIKNIKAIHHDEMMKKPKCLEGELVNQWIWATDKEGRDTGVPIDSYNHACDALRYVALNKLAVSNSGKYVVV